MLRTFARAAGIMALLPAAALAQAPDATTNGVPFNMQRAPTQEEIDKRQAADRDYNAAMKKIPDRKESSDPWGDVRPTASTSASSKKKQPPQQ
jgi:hypothetical protein